MSYRRHDLEDQKLELVCVEIKLSHKNVFLLTVYIPPYFDLNSLSSLDCNIGKIIKKISTNDNIIILGDFNQRAIRWEYDVNGSLVAANHDSLPNLNSRFLEILHSHNLYQFNQHVTCNTSVLDLVITDGISANVHITENAVKSNHKAIEASFEIALAAKTKTTPRIVHSYKKANFPNILQVLSCIWWGTVNTSASVDESFDNFYDIIYAVMNEYVPKITIRNRKYPQWYDHDIISMINEKFKWRKKFISLGRNTLSTAFANFSKLRAEVKKKQQALYSEYIDSISNEIKLNSKRFWTFVKYKRSFSSVPKQMLHKDKVLNTTKLIATAFNEHFKSLFVFNEPMNDIFMDMPYSNVSCFRVPEISPEAVRKKLKELKPNVANGADNISPVFLLNCADELCTPLANLFNLSLSKGVYPTILKRNNVIPIFKKGKKNSIENYRAISIQPIIGKIFESFVNDALRNHLKLLICDQQHGFVTGRSTASNLAIYTEIISKCFDDKSQLHSLYTDFSRAFDTVPHNLLLFKMCRQFGIEGNYLEWFESYLTNRYQRVVLDGEKSEWVSVTSGVPQGSILGPTLFLMYINDLPDVLQHSRCLLFADDAKFFKEIANVDDCHSLQSDMNNVVNWCKHWRILLNIKKCFHVNFSMLRSRNIDWVYFINDQCIEKVSSIKDLGVTFTYNLNFSTHINNIVKKSMQMYGFMKRILKPVCDPAVYISLYHTLIRSRLEYCSFIWSPLAQSYSDKIERVQKNFFRFLAYKCNLHNMSYVDLCIHFKFQTLKSRRDMLDVRMLNKILTNRIDCPELLSFVSFNVPIVNNNLPLTRSRARQNNHERQLFSCNHRLRVRQNSPIIRSMTLTNDSNLDVLSPTPVFRKDSSSYFSF